MKVILSHVNTDFDALASMLAAKKLYPDAQMVITDKVNAAVKQFLAIYRDSIDLVLDHQVTWDQVTEIILVDVASLDRVGNFINQLNLDSISFTVFDHHPTQEGDLEAGHGSIEQVGATVTLLIEEIQKRNMELSFFEATIFGLGIYTDTGNFTYSNTTPRDLSVASYLLTQGMNLELINRFDEQVDYGEQNIIFNQLFINSKEFELDGLNIVISSHHQKKFQGGLSTLTRKLVETTGADAVITVVEMQKRVYVVGRASSNRVNFLPLMQVLGGGGHEKAASATIKNGDLEEILHTVQDKLKDLLLPAITAEAIMASPVKSIPPETTIEKAAEMMYRYGHTGFPVISEDKLCGIISRRDIDKATHHGLGHAPVKAYMTSKVITISPNTSLEEIQNTMIKHNIGRLPVVLDGKVLGILSRTNVIEVLHNEKLKKELERSAILNQQNNLKAKMKQLLPEDLYQLLLEIGQGADEANIDAYMIGGIVRDLILGRENDDVDVVVEGDGIAFATFLSERFGGEVKIHEDFGTSTWKHPSGTKIDITTSRFEYYDHPAALPTVEHSNLREDLSRRDFTINAMAIHLNESSFGDIIDFFSGREHLQDKSIKILHNLSFVEDPTRILRAVRFETRFGFKMDQQTLELANISMDKMRNVSKHRTSNELQKLFKEGKPLVAMQRLFEIEFWSTLIDSFTGEGEIITHCKRLQNTLKDYREIEINKQLIWYMYALLPFYKQKEGLHFGSTYALNRKEMKIVEEIQYIEEIWPDMKKQTSSHLHRQFKKLSNEALLFFFTHPDQELEYEVGIHYLIDRMTIPVLLTGEDLKALGIQPGPIYSSLLLELELAFLKKQITTKEQATLWVKQKIERD